MKKTTLGLIIGLLLGSTGIAYAAFSTFTSSQLGNSQSNGYLLQTNGSGANTWVATSSLGISGGSGSPGGSNTQIQYNNSGSFAGASPFQITSGGNTMSFAAGGSVLNNIGWDNQGIGSQLNLLKLTQSGANSTSTFVGNVNIGSGQEFGSGLLGGQTSPFFIIANNQNDLMTPVTIQNLSDGAYAAGCLEFNNNKTTNSGITATYYATDCMSGGNFNDANAPGGGLFLGSQIPGLPPNSLVRVSTDGYLLFGSLSSNIASSGIVYSIGPGYSSGNYDVVYKIVTGTSTGVFNAGEGIGTTTPDARLTITASTSQTNIPYIDITQMTNGVSKGSVFTLNNNGSLNYGSPNRNNGIIASTTGSFAGGNMAAAGGGIFATSSSGGNMAHGYVNSSGTNYLYANGSGCHALGAVNNSSGYNMGCSGTGGLVGGNSLNGDVINTNSGIVWGDNIKGTNTNSSAIGTGFTNNTANSFSVGYGTSPTLTVTASLASTSNLLVSSAAGTGTRCAQFASDGTLGVNASACGSGGGSAGGTWSTTTSSVSGRLINYPNNNTDIVSVGGSATTSDFVYIDPNLKVLNMVNGGTYNMDSNPVLYASTTASDTIVGTNVNPPIFTVDAGGGQTLIGDHAGAFLTAGSNENTIIGEYAGASTTIGSENTIIGGHAVRGLGLQTGNERQTIAIGVDAGEGLIGFDNTAVGDSSLIHTKNNANTALGMWAGFTNVKGDNNVFVGSGTGWFTNASSSIIIGAMVDSPYTSTNGILNIGDVMYGSGMYNNPTPTIFGGSTGVSSVPTTAGEIAIGTTTPYSRLTVWGSPSGNILEVVNSASTTNLTVSSTGNGTTTVSGLNISGSATSTSNVGYNITTGCFAVSGVCVGGNGGGGSGTVNSGTLNQFAFYNTSGTAVSGTSTINVTQAGVISFDPGANSGTNGTIQMFNSPVNTPTIQITNGNSSVSGSKIGIDSNNALIIQNTENNAIYLKNQNGLVMTIATSSIFAGIGTTSPYAALSVVGSTGVVADHYTATSTATSTFTGGFSTNLLNIVSTTATSSAGNGIDLSNGCFSIRGVCASGGGGGGSGTVNSGNFPQLAWYSANGTAVSGTSTAPLWIGSFNATTTTATSTESGSLQIATTTGTGALDVNGAIHSEMASTTAGTANANTYDFCYANSVQRYFIGATNQTVTLSNASRCPGQTMTFFVIAPASGVIGSTTFSGGTGSGIIMWDGGINPGNDVLNGLTDRFTFTSTASSTSFISGDLSGSY